MFVLKVENSLLLNQFKSLQLKLDVLLNHHPLKDFVVISGPNLKKQYPNTVKLGYNDHGCNEFMAVKNKYNSSFLVPNDTFTVITLSRL
jgi:hypothetical protein